MNTLTKWALIKFNVVAYPHNTSKEVIILKWSDQEQSIVEILEVWKKYVKSSDLEVVDVRVENYLTLDIKERYSRMGLFLDEFDMDTIFTYVNR
jgi:hypothetical protein